MQGISGAVHRSSYNLKAKKKLSGHPGTDIYFTQVYEQFCMFQQLINIWTFHTHCDY